MNIPYVETTSVHLFAFEQRQRINSLKDFHEIRQGIPNFTKIRRKSDHLQSHFNYRRPQVSSFAFQVSWPILGSQSIQQILKSFNNYEFNNSKFSRDVGENWALVGYQTVLVRGSADKSLARPTSR